MGGRLIRRTSPSTRIIGGNPADRCRSDAPCLAEKARSSVISIGFLGRRFFCTLAGLVFSRTGGNVSPLSAQPVTISKYHEQHSRQHPERNPTHSKSNPGGRSG